MADPFRYFILHQKPTSFKLCVVLAAWCSLYALIRVCLMSSYFDFYQSFRILNVDRVAEILEMQIYLRFYHQKDVMLFLKLYLIDSKS